MSEKRPSVDEYFINIAKTVATRGTCPRRNVGAVITRDKRIISTGYNGSPRGMPHCIDVGCDIKILKNPEGKEQEYCLRTVHAELNAIIQAAIHGVSTEGATLYCTDEPCGNCAKAIVNAGIKRVVFLHPYHDPDARKIFSLANVVLEQFKHE